MKICFLSDISSVHTQKWIKWFVEQGHDVHVISETPLDTKMTTIQNFYHLKATPFGLIPTLLSFIVQIRQIIRKIMPDVINAHFASSYGFWGMFCSFKPYVLTAWGSDVLLYPKRGWLQKQLVKKTLNYADLITCDANHMREAILTFDVPAKNIKIVNFGIDIKKFSPGRKDRNIWGKFGIKVEDRIVISTRSLRPIYDLETLIKAVPLILKKIPNVKFIIIGQGEQKEYLERLAQSLGVANNIIFMGIVPNDDLPVLLASSDIYVSTALSDGGIAASTAEAMACGLPVVITDFGDNKSWIDPPAGGLLFPPKNSEALAENILFFLQDTALRVKCGQRNRPVIVERNNYDKEMKQVENYFIDLKEGEKT